MVEQEYLDYPCLCCKRLRSFVSTFSPNGHWVCTECNYRISDKYMRKWQVVKKKLLERGIRFELGMSLIYPFQDRRK